MFSKLASLEMRLEAVNRMLMDPTVLSDPKRMRSLSREHSQLSEIVGLWETHKQLEEELQGAKELLDDDDDDVREMAKGEISELEDKLEKSTEELRFSLLPKDPYEGRPILLEIRAGTGGDEAALFAAVLFGMYARFAESKRLKLSVMSSSLITVGGGAGKSAQGFKEIIASISGKAAYRLLKFESGVHRVQRVPLTESQGRIHTSAATVAVLPEPDEVELNIDQNELRIDRFRSSGPGGQSVNTTDSAIRIVHIPTGLTVQCQDEKSQHKNLAKAMRVLKARLLESMESERHAEEAAARKAMVGSGDRSERIRTYNFPQNRLTDHRIGLTLYKLDSIIEGNLMSVVDALTTHHQAQLLASQDMR